MARHGSPTVSRARPRSTGLVLARPPIPCDQVYVILAPHLLDHYASTYLAARAEGTFFEGRATICYLKVELALEGLAAAFPADTRWERRRVRRERDAGIEFVTNAVNSASIDGSMWWRAAASRRSSSTSSRADRHAASKGGRDAEHV